MSNLLEIRSVEQIAGDLYRKILIETDLTSIAPGSSTAVLIEAVAVLIFQLQMSILKILENSGVDSLVGIALDRKAESLGIPNTQGSSGRIPATFASGLVTIGSSFTKISSKFYAGKPAPYAGSTKIYVEDASSVPSSGSLYIARGTASRFEGPILFSGVTDFGSYWEISLSQPLTKSHPYFDEVVIAQGGNRNISAGTIVQIPATTGRSTISYSTVSAATIPDGEVSVDVLVICSQSGEIGNALVGAINAFASEPFTGATVVNNSAFINGSSVENDENLRRRIKNYPSTLSRGTTQAILAAIAGARDPDTGSSIVSASILAPVEEGDTARVYIDDGLGLEPTFLGQAYELLLNSASGQETVFNTAKVPITPCVIVGSEAAPFVLEAGESIEIVIDGVSEVYTITASNYANLNSATAYEVVRDFNSQANMTGWRTVDSGTRIAVFDLSGQSEVMSVLAGDLPVKLGLSTKQIRPLFLYKNSELLSFKGKTATITTRLRSLWGVSSPIYGSLKVDGVTQNFTISSADFAEWGTDIPSASITQWQTVFARKVAGVKFTAVGGALVFSTYNVNSSTGSVEVLDSSDSDWVGANGIFSEYEADVGRSQDYKLNRFTGGIELLQRADLYDKIEIGSRSTRAQVVSSISSTGLFNTAPQLPGIGSSKFIVGFDGDFELKDVTASSTTTLTPTLITAGNVRNIVRWTCNSNIFINLGVGDYVWLIQDTSVVPGWGSSIQGVYRVKSLSADGTWIEVEISETDRPDWLAIDGVAQALSENMVHGFTCDNAFPQVVDLGIAVSSYSVDDIVSEINDQISSGTAVKINPQQFAVRSNNYEGGVCAVLAVVGAISSAFAKEIASSIQAHTANDSSQDIDALFPIVSNIVKLNPSSGVYRGYLYVDRNSTDITGTGDNPAIQASADIANYPVGFQELALTGKQSGLVYRVYNNQTLAPFSGQVNTIRRIKPLGTSDNNQTTPNTYDRYSNISLRLNDINFSANDKLTLQLDSDATDKTISVLMAKNALIQDIDALTSEGKGTVISFRLKDPDDSDKPFFDSSSIYKNFDFVDFRILTKSIGVYRLPDNIPSLSPWGSLTAIDYQTGALSLDDGDTFILNDGVNPALTFEFDSNGSVLPGNVAITVVAGVKATGSFTAVDAHPITGIVDGDWFILDDGINPPVTFEYDTDGVWTPGRERVNIGPVALQSTGSLTAIAEGVAGVQDGDTFVLDDGINPSITFEFDTDGSVIPTPTLRPVTISVGYTDAQVKNAMILAISGATIDITVSSGAGMLIDLINDNYGVAGNIAITETIASLATLTPVGMTGGVDGMSASNVASAMRSAINTVVGGLYITAGGIGTTVSLTHDYYGVIGNIAFTPLMFSFINGVSLSASGMSGGVDGSDATAVKTAIISAISLATIDITAFDASGDEVYLANDHTGVAGNIAITETIASGATLTPVGMSGGTAAPGLLADAVTLRSANFGSQIFTRFALVYPLESDQAVMDVTHANDYSDYGRSTILVTMKSGAEVVGSRYNFSGDNYVITAVPYDTYLSKLTINAPGINPAGEYVAGNILNIGGTGLISGSYYIYSATSGTDIIEVLAPQVYTDMSGTYNAAQYPISSFPIDSMTLADLETALNNYLTDNPVISAEVLGTSTTPITYPTYLLYKASSSAGSGIGYGASVIHHAFECKKSGIASVYQYDSSNPLVNGIKATIQSDDNLFPIASDVIGTTYTAIGEEIRIVPANSKSLNYWLSSELVSSLPILAISENHSNDGKVQISSLEDGSSGGVEITGVSADYVESYVLDNASEDNNSIKLQILHADAKALMPGSFVRVDNSVSSEIQCAYRNDTDPYFKDSCSVEYERVGATTSRFSFLRESMDYNDSYTNVFTNREKLFQSPASSVVVTFSSLGDGTVRVHIASHVAQYNMSTQVGEMMYINPLSGVPADLLCPALDAVGLSSGLDPEYIGYPVVKVVSQWEVHIKAPNITSFAAYTFYSPYDILFIPAVWQEKNIRTNMEYGCKFDTAINNAEAYAIVKRIGDNLISVFLQNSATEATDSMYLDECEVSTNDYAVLGDAFKPANRGTFQIVAHNGRNHLVLYTPDGECEDELVDFNGETQRVAIDLFGGNYRFTVATAIVDDTPVKFLTTDELPANINPDNTYYVINSVGLTFNIAAAVGGTAITGAITQSGYHWVSDQSIFGQRKWRVGPLLSERPIRIIDLNSVRIGDKLRISSSYNSTVQWMPQSLIGSFTISKIGYDYRLHSNGRMQALAGTTPSLDGSTFILNDGVHTAITFEFDSNGTYTSGRIPVTFLGTDSAAQIAVKMAAAINNQNASLDIRAIVDGSYINLFNLSKQSFYASNQLITVAGAYSAASIIGMSVSARLTSIAGSLLADGDTFTLDDDSTTYTFEFDSGGGVTPGNIAIAFTGAETATQIASLVVAAINGSATPYRSVLHSDGVTILIYHRVFGVAKLTELLASGTLTPISCWYSVPPVAGLSSYVECSVANAPAYVLNSSNIAIRCISLGVNSESIGFVEGETPFSIIAMVHGSAVNPINTDQSDVFLVPSRNANKISKSYGSELISLDKLSYELLNHVGIDGYQVFIGLVAEAHRIIDGDPSNSVAYPSVKAAGTTLEVIPPLKKAIQIALTVHPKDGVSLNSLIDVVRTVVAQYVKSLGIGKPVILSEIIKTVQSVSGVMSVSIDSTMPAAVDDRIAVADIEKCYVYDATTDITVG